MRFFRLALALFVFSSPGHALEEGEADSFSPAVNGTVRAMLPTATGGVLIGGDFTAVNGVPCPYVAMLRDDGSLDPGFDPGLGADGPVHCLVRSGNGGYYLGGEFLNYGGVARSRIARITEAGALDGSFDPGSGANATVRCLSTEFGSSSAGSSAVWAGGDFTSFRGAAVGYFALLAPSGSFFTSFAPGGTPSAQLAANGPVRAFAGTQEGMFVGGDFTSWGVGSAGRLVLVNWNLVTVDRLLGSFNGPVTALVATRGWSSFMANNLICMGSFTTSGGQARPGFALFSRLGFSSTYTLRAVTHTLTGGPGRCATYVPAGSTFDSESLKLGGEFTSFNGAPANGLAHFQQFTQPPYDLAYLSPYGGYQEQISPAPRVLAMAAGPEDRVYVAGSFSRYGGAQRSNIARIYGPKLNALPSPPDAPEGLGAG